MLPVGVVALLLIIGAPPAPAAAMATSAPPTAAPARGERAHDGGVVSGRVASVDYQRGALGVDAKSGHLDIMVMPTTSIQSKDPGYHTITDIKPGQQVEIYSSIIGGKYVAQIIRLL